MERHIAIRRSWSKAQLEWYHDCGFALDRWWREGDCAIAKRPDGKSTVSVVPLLWEIFRRHPDVGVVFNVLREHQPNSRKQVNAWLVSLFGYRSKISQIINLLVRRAEKPWSILKGGARKQFDIVVSELIRTGRISSQVSIPNPAPVSDVWELLRLTSFSERGLPLEERANFRQAVKKCREMGLGSLHDTTLFDLHQAISFLGQDLIVLAVDRNSTHDLVTSEFSQILKQSQKTQTLSDHAKVHGSYKIESKAHNGPPPPRQLIDILQKNNPHIEFALQSHTGGYWSISKIYRLRRGRSGAPTSGRFSMELYDFLEELDKRKVSAYPKINRMMSRYSLFTLL